MNITSGSKYPNLKVGQNIGLKMRNINRAEIDPKSINSVYNRVRENEFYQVILNQLYTQRKKKLNFEILSKNCLPKKLITQQ